MAKFLATLVQNKEELMPKLEDNSDDICVSIAGF